MKKKKKSTKEICESSCYKFLNDYHFDIKMKEAFDKHFELFLSNETDIKHQYYVSHRNFFFVMAYKNGYSLPFIAPIFGKKHCSILHGIHKLTERIQIKDSITMKAKENVIKFLASYKQTIEKKIVIKDDEFIREGAKDLIDSVKAFDFFDEFEFDLENLILFKSKLGVKFVTRQEPDIFYRNFLIIALSKKYDKLKTVGTLFDLSHASVINAIKRTCNFVENNDKEIMEIFEKVKFFFNRYCKRKVNPFAIRQAI